MRLLKNLPDISQTSARIGNRNIAYSQVGNGPTVLMLHGGGPGASGLSNYSRNIHALAEKFTLIIPDMPGYGHSTKGLDGKDPFGDLAGSMIGLLDHLKLTQASIVGNSLGGACALRMALDAPKRVSRLVLMGPGGVDTTRGLPTAGLKHLLDYYTGDGPGLEKLRQFIREDLVYDASDVPEELIQERFKASIDPEVVASPPLRRPKGIPKFRKIDFTRDPRLSELQTPTLVLWGAEDRVNRPSGGHSLQKRMPNCDFYLYARTGHWIQWERADEFNAVTAAFLASDYLFKSKS